jgi:hypothetical protein
MMDGFATDFLAADSATGVLFIEDFDDPPQDGRGDRPEIIAPCYTAEDVEAAREEGRLAGIEEARADHDVVQSALCNAALTAIGEALDASRADAGAVAEKIGASIAGTVLALLTAALPATAAKLAPAEINALLAALLPPLSETPNVAVRVHPDVLPDIAHQLGAFSSVVASGDASMAPSDVAIAWRDGNGREGSARRDWAALWVQITDALAPFGLPAHLAALLPHAEGTANGSRS